LNICHVKRSAHLCRVHEQLAERRQSIGDRLKPILSTFNCFKPFIIFLIAIEPSMLCKHVLKNGIFEKSLSLLLDHLAVEQFYITNQLAQGGLFLFRQSSAPPPFS
jgi:hypothetical protein